MPHRTIRPPVAVDLDTAHDRSWLKTNRIRVALLATTGFLGALLSLLLIALFLPATQDAADAQAIVCHKYASPSGSDGASGTSSSPYRTAQRLVDSLSSGQVGCLRSGTYTDSNRNLTIKRAGITLRSAPNSRATIAARVFVPPGADRLTVSGLTLRGTPGISNVLIRSNYTRWLNNEVTNYHRNICFVVGSQVIATGTLIEGNRIHNCGKMPRANHDHGIYVNSARNTKIIGNLIYDNADRGVQLYPNAQSTLVEGNIINNNGQSVLFAGSSSNNIVRGNVLSNPVGARIVGPFNVIAPGRITSGRGNLVVGNCLWTRSGTSGINTNPSVFAARDNIVAHPSSSRCRSVL
jgi:parallel beta-helix repeat protein